MQNVTEYSDEWRPLKLTLVHSFVVFNSRPEARQSVPCLIFSEFWHILGPRTEKVQESGIAQEIFPLSISVEVYTYITTLFLLSVHYRAQKTAVLRFSRNHHQKQQFYGFSIYLTPEKTTTNSTVFPETTPG